MRAEGPQGGSTSLDLDRTPSCRGIGTCEATHTGAVLKAPCHMRGPAASSRGSGACTMVLHVRATRGYAAGHRRSPQKALRGRAQVLAAPVGPRAKDRPGIGVQCPSKHLPGVRYPSQGLWITAIAVQRCTHTRTHCVGNTRMTNRQAGVAANRGVSGFSSGCYNQKQSMVFNM